MFARGAAAKVAPGHQNFRAARFGAIQHEIANGRAVTVIAPIRKQLRAQALLGGGGEKARWNDLIGVDVARADADGLGAKALDRLHYNSSRGSAMRPLTALAAAVSG